MTSTIVVAEVVKVIVREVDKKGRVNLSIKATGPDFAKHKGLQPEHNGGNNTKDE